MRDFAFSRATRFYSVAIPALLIGFLCDRLGSSLFPEYYAKAYFNPIGLIEQLASGLTFSSEWWLVETRLGTNGPYWSLSNEAAYYALFAVIFYLRSGLKWLVAVCLCAVFGPKILILLPCWIMGLAAWRFIASGRELPLRWAYICTFVPAAVYAIFVILQLPEQLRELYPSPLYEILKDRDLLFEWAFILSILVSVHLIGVHSLVKMMALPDRARTISAVRYLSGASFSIYLLHFPIFHILTPALAPLQIPYLQDLILLTLTLAICLVVAALFERTLGTQRRAILAIAGPFRRSKPIA